MASMLELLALPGMDGSRKLSKMYKKMQAEHREDMKAYFRAVAAMNEPVTVIDLSSPEENEPSHDNAKKVEYTYEFELVQCEDDGSYLALPYDFYGGVKGNIKEATISAAHVFLRKKINEYLGHNIKLPKPTFNNKKVFETGERLVVSITV